MKVFSVYDNKASVWMQPFFCLAVGQAIRAFADEARRSDSLIGRHPADYVLFMIGDFEEFSGRLVPAPVPVNLGMGSDHVAPAVQASLPLLAGEPPTDATGLLAGSQVQQARANGEAR